ncbi:MAG: hypothetical protein INR73_06255 [Williamsia sp.]|nr:hypothetical protein [Williamsia sp.]
MSIPQEKQEKLIAYFEGKLSAEEEISFLQEVENDEALQKEFDWELLLRYEQFNELNTIAHQDQAEEFEPADAHIDRIKEAWKQGGTQEGSVQPASPVVRLRRFTVAAAIFVLALGAALFYLLYFKKQTPDVVHREPPVKHDSGRIHEEKMLPDPGNRERVLAENSERAEKAYKKYYRKYTGSEEDPVQASKYLYAYNESRYDDVINGTAKELISKGANTPNSTLEAYLNFYQGISYLHTKKSAPAITKLREVLGQVSSKNQLYYDASWYLAMAYLQGGTPADASQLLQQLADSKRNTSYKKRAAAILKSL